MKLIINISLLIIIIIIITTIFYLKKSLNNIYNNYKLLDLKKINYINSTNSINFINNNKSYLNNIKYKIPIYNKETYANNELLWELNNYYYYNKYNLNKFNLIIPKFKCNFYFNSNINSLSITLIAKQLYKLWKEKIQLKTNEKDICFFDWCNRISSIEEDTQLINLKNNYFYLFDLTETFKNFDYNIEENICNCSWLQYNIYKYKTFLQKSNFIDWRNQKTIYKYKLIIKYKFRTILNFIRKYQVIMSRLLIKDSNLVWNMNRTKKLNSNITLINPFSLINKIKKVNLVNSNNKKYFLNIYPKVYSDEIILIICVITIQIILIISEIINIYLY